ncbi:Receptor-like protein 1 [Citrus sinensis]|nr:Receptor-like protein 1 [Citrus sinensis]
MNEIHGYKGCLETERTALLEIKSFFISVSDIGYDDKILPSWVGEDDGMPSDCCDDWEGVKCSATTRRVMQLSLNYTRRSYYYDGTSASLLNMSSFHPFEELQSLDLSENWFTGIYEKRAYDSFGSLKQLKILDLGDSSFNDSILPYLNTLTSLTTLILSDNSIEGSRTKQGLANLRYLQVLDLSMNFNITSASLTRLGLTNLTNLRKLYLAGCGITTIQAKLKNMEALDFSSNYYIHGLANLTNLQVLDLSGNQNLTTLGLANLTNLQVLDLSGNQNLTTLGFADLPNLKTLDLGSCGITTIQGI